MNDSNLVQNQNILAGSLSLMKPDSNSSTIINGVNVLKSINNVTMDSYSHTSIIAISTALICSVGFTGNLLNFVVLYAYHTSQINFGGECSAKVNLIGLALADFFVCLTSLPLGFSTRSYKSFSVMLVYTIVGPALANYFMTVSVWMVLLMSIVRYFAVCRPLTSRSLLTPHHMLRIIIFIYMAALIFHIPSFLMHTYRNDSIIEGNWSRIYVVDEREFWSNPIVNYCYYVMTIIYTNLGPFIGVVISNLAVIRACRRSDAHRRSLAELQYARQCSKDDNILNQRNIAQFFYTRQRCDYNSRNYNFPISKLALYNSVTPTYRMSLNKYPNRATNRVTPLLLAVIFAFLVFNAPFGIIHYVCIHVVRGLGIRVRDDVQVRKLYSALNLTIQWTNVIQLLGFASNFFLYFLVSTTFRRTAKRTFRKFYKQIRTCRAELVVSCFYCETTKSSTHSSWNNDSRTEELRRALDYGLNDHIQVKNGQIELRPNHSLKMQNLFRTSPHNDLDKLESFNSDQNNCFHGQNMHKKYKFPFRSQLDVSNRTTTLPLYRHLSAQNSTTSQPCPYSNSSPMSLPNAPLSRTRQSCVCNKDHFGEQDASKFTDSGRIIDVDEYCLCGCSHHSSGSHSIRIATT